MKHKVMLFQEIPWKVSCVLLSYPIDSNIRFFGLWEENRVSASIGTVLSWPNDWLWPEVRTSYVRGFRWGTEINENNENKTSLCFLFFQHERRKTAGTKKTSSAVEASTGTGGNGVTLIMQTQKHSFRSRVLLAVRRWCQLKEYFCKSCLSLKLQIILIL